MKQLLQLWSALAPLHRVGAAALTAGNLVASVVEVIGLALFGAVLLRLTQPGGGAIPLGLPWVTNQLGGADLRTVVVACGVVYLAKNILMVALAWLEARLAFGVQAHMTGLTLAALLRQDYEAASRVPQSARINLLTTGMYALAFNVLVPGLTLFAEGLLMLALIVFLVATQPAFVTMMLSALCLVAGGLVAVSRRMVLHLGGTRHRSEDDRMQLLAGIFGHLREMYIYSAGPRAVGHLQGMLAPLAASYRGFQLLQTTPRFLLEIALVGVLLAVVYWQSAAGVEPSLVVSIGVFGVAGFRLLLGINRIVACVQAMRFAAPTLERITQALASGSDGSPSVPPPVHGAAATEPRSTLRLVDVTYEYEGGRPVLRGVNLELPRGSLVAIKGKSGAGKSTLLDVLAGLRSPTSGWIELDGRRVAHKSGLLGRIAYAGQNPAVFPDTIRSNVAFGVAVDRIDDAAVWRALAKARLDGVVRQLPGQLDFRLGLSPTLSGGQVQRLALARALYMDCDYLLLDEPTAALDAETERELLATLKDLSAAAGVLVVSHRQAPLDAADLVLELSDGALAGDGTPAASALAAEPAA